MSHCSTDLASDALRMHFACQVKYCNAVLWVCRFCFVFDLELVSGIEELGETTLCLPKKFGPEYEVNNVWIMKMGN